MSEKQRALEARAQWRLALVLTGAMMAIYFTFILLVAWAKPLLTTQVALGLSLGILLGAVAWTLGITFWAARRTISAEHFYTAGRSVTGLQNGLALEGDYMSAASFLGIAGLVSISGFDGFIYSIGVRSSVPRRGTIPPVKMKACAGPSSSPSRYG